MRKWTFLSALRTWALQRDTTLIFLDVLSLFKEMRLPGAQEGRLTPHQGAEGPGVQGIEVSVLGGSVSGSPETLLEVPSERAGEGRSCRKVSRFPSACLSALLPQKATG